MGIAAGAMLVGGGISAAGQIRSANAGAKVARNNALMQQWQADSVMRQGVEQAAAIRAEGERTAGAARAATVANNISTSVGSMEHIGDISRMNAERDAEIIKANAALQAWGHKVEGQNALEQARINKEGAMWGAAGSILGGAGQAGLSYGSWYGSYKGRGV
jgi:hypothetical protein